MTPFLMFLGGLLTQKKGKLENRGLSCQSFLEILRISEKVRCETHLKSKGVSWKYSVDKSSQAKKKRKISCDSPFQFVVVKLYFFAINHLQCSGSLWFYYGSGSYPFPSDWNKNNFLKHHITNKKFSWSQINATDDQGGKTYARILIFN
jgi:hypothetical protein